MSETQKTENGNAGRPAQSFFSAAISVLSSLKLTIFILVTIAFVSIFGTVVEQGKQAQSYYAEYGERWGDIIMMLRLDDMFHTGWFTSLLVLLVVNIIACTYERFPAKWRTLLRHSSDINPNVFDTLSHSTSFELAGDVSSAREKALGALSQKGYKKFVEKETQGGKRVIYAWKGIAGRFGSDITHVSLFFILLGCIIGGYWGYRDYRNISVGETISVPDAEFTIKLENFWIDYYDNGSIRQYNSLLTVYEGDKEVQTKQIWVNEPLRYGGITFYQSSWGKSWNRVAGAEIFLRRIDTGQDFPAVSTPWEEVTAIPGTPYSIKLDSFVSDFAFDPENKQIYSTGMDHKNPAVRVEVFEKGKSRGKAWLFGNYPGLVQAIPGSKYDLVLNSYTPVIFSGLSITKDPGTNLVWLGCLIMGIGMYLALFVHYKRMWVEISGDSKVTMVRVAALTNKSVFALERDFNDVVKTLKGE